MANFVRLCLGQNPQSSETPMNAKQRPSLCWQRAAKLLLPAVMLIYAWSAFNAAAQITHPSPPPEPRVKPVIPRYYPEDPAGHRIMDSLREKAGRATSAASNQLTEVQLVFTRQVTQGQIDTFAALGGSISYMYRSVTYGWNGRLPLGQVARLPAALGDSLILVREPRQARLYLLNATMQGRVRTVWAPGYYGFAPGFSGSNDTSIGIIDTGVDSTHEDLTNRCLYWKDQSSDAYATNRDIVQHGSHVAGIAFGTGAASGNAAGPLAFTLVGSFAANTAAGDLLVEPLALVTNNTTWSATAKFQGGGETALDLDSSTAGKNNFNPLAEGLGSSPIGFTNTFSPSAANIYMAAVESAVSGAVATNYVITNHLSYYPGPPDSFNRLRGVAPGCTYVAEKVATDTDSLPDSWIDAAIDDLTTLRTNYHVKVINLSLGGGGTDTTMRADVNSAVNNGIVAVVAAGNDGASDTAITDPGAAALAITVAAANSQIALTEYSSVGFTNLDTSSGQQSDYKPDLMAPGGSQYYGGILSVDSNSGDGTEFSDQVPNDYTVMYGTSMATPFVAGAAALVIQALEANGTTWNYDSSTDPMLVKMLLNITATESNTNREGGNENPTLQRATAGPAGYPAGKDPYEGYGMINVDAAIQAVQQKLFSGFATNYTLGGSNTAPRAWAGNFADNGRPVCVSLTVPATGDFDVYLYSSTPGAYGAVSILASGTQAGNGVSESFIYRPAAAGTNYLVVKDISGLGSFSLVISNFNNDNFTNAQTIAGTSGELLGTNVSFTTQSGEPAPAGGYASAWYSWTPVVSGYAAFIASNGIPTVYTGSSVSSLTALSGQGTGSTNVVTVTAGTNYYVQVCAKNSTGTNFLLSWSELAPTYVALNPGGVTMAKNVSSSPYPSTVLISNLLGTIIQATVTFSNYSFAGAANCDSLLVSPQTNSIALMIGSGDMSTFSNLTVTFAAGGAYPPGSSVLTNGVYEPSCPEAFESLDSPAPKLPYSTNLADVVGESPNGAWSLYAEANNNVTYTGSISNWSLNLSLDIPPAFAVNPTTLNYTNGSSGSNVTGAAVITSLYYQNLNGGGLTVQLTTNAAASDVLAIQNQGAGAGEIGASGGAVSYGGVKFGSYSGGTSGSTPLVISFTNATATLPVVAQLITNIVFTSPSSSNNLRTVEFVLTDPSGGSTNAATTVALTAGNPAPLVANPIASQTAGYGGKFNLTFAANVFTDAVASLTFAYTATGLPSGISLTNATRAFGGTASQAGSFTVGLVATDNGSPPLSATDTFNLTVSPAALSVTASNFSRAYGGTNPVFTGLVLGVTNGDSITGAYASAATTNSPPGAYAITAGLSDPADRLPNYTVTTNNGALTVTAATVTVTPVAQFRAYGSTNPVFSVNYTGLTNGQTFSSSGITGSPVLTTTATTNSSPGSYAISNSIGTLASSDYAFTLSNGTLTVTQALLTVTASNVFRSYGATNPVFAAGYSGFVNAQTLANSGVSGQPALTTAAATNSPPGVYVITNAAGTLSSANYAFAPANGSLTVTQATLLVTANPVARVYGGTNPGFTVSYAGFTNGQSLATSDLAGAPALATAATTNSGTGVYAITNTAGTLTSTDYSLTFSNGALTVTQAVLTVAANNFQRVYGGANPAFTVTYSGFTNAQTLAGSGVTGSPSLTTTAATASAVGAYAISNALGSLTASNYSFNLVNGTLTVFQALLTAGANSFSRTYGATNPLFTGTLTGVAASDDLTASYSSTATTNSAPGAYLIVPALLDPDDRLPNYNVTTIDGTLTVSAAVLTVSANAAARAYGSTNPTFTASYGGFVNGQSSGSGTVTGAPLLSTAAATNSPVGSYVITNQAGTLASSDYTFTFSNSLLVVTQALLTVTPANATRGYGQANPVLTGTITGLVNNDNLTATYATTATTASPVGAYPVTATLSDPQSRLPNYSVTTNQAILTITNLAGSNSYLAMIYVSNSVIRLATNVTMNLTFTDPLSGLAAVVAVAMTPYSSVTNDPAFTLLDTYGYNHSPVHLGIDSGLGGGDGNWVDPFEGVNVSASLVSAASGIISNSVQFGVLDIGLRPGGAAVQWTSSATTNSFSVTAEMLYPLDTNTAAAAGSTYAGMLRTFSGSQYQISDLYPTTNQSLVFGASFAVGGGTTPELSFGLSGSQFQLAVTGTTGAPYVVEVTTNLAAPVWVSVATNTAPFIFVETNAGLYLQRYYRAVSAP